MDSIIHQAQKTDDNAELTALTGNESRSRERGGFLRSLFCCFGDRRNSHTYEEVSDPPPEEPSPKQEEFAVPDPSPVVSLLGPADDPKKICCVIDLDETLVHSSFKPIANADFHVPVEIENMVHQVYVLKRPYVDEFLAKVGELFECVLFTASLAKYADEVANEIDPNNEFSSRLFRESCVYDRGNYVKDLTKLGRQLDRTIIIDNSPASYLFQPQNAIPVSSWFEDKNDTLLRDIIPDMERIAESTPEDFYTVVRQVQQRIAELVEGYNSQ